ncbi:MAG: hypothetical protein K2H85_08175, partial [Allobaculum sp.]|nr:hypothetical protein [Allobaculum sp.]
LNTDHKQVVWDTQRAWNDIALKENNANAKVDPPDLRPHNYPSNSLSATEAREADPKFVMELENDGTIKTENVLYRLFKDEASRYFEKPGMRYMNKLFNSLDPDDDGILEYNENYTLAQIWLGIVETKDIKEEINFEDDSRTITFSNDALQNDIKNTDKNFAVIEVPEAEGEANKGHHDPSKIYLLMIKIMLC